MQQDNQPKIHSSKQKILKWLRLHRKALIIALCILAVALLAIPGGVVEKYVSVISRTQYDGVLLSSLENTLKLEQVKFHARLDKKAVDTSSYQQDLVIDGVFKKGAGLSASTDSTSIGLGTKMTQKSRWIIDSHGVIYVNLQYFGTETMASSPVQNNQAMNDMVKKIVDNNNNLNKDVWMKHSDDKDLLNTFNTTGLNGCSVKAYYAVQSDPKEFLNLVKQLAQNVEPRKTGNAGSTDLFTITAMPSRYSEVNRIYTNSELYKRLVACNPSDYSATQKSTSATLKDVTITVKIDKKKKFVSSLTFASKDKFTFEATFTPTSDVNITVPKESEPVKTLSNISMKQILEEYPHDYEHMQEAADVLKYGACVHLDKYRHLAPQEAIDICEKMKNYKPPTE